MYLLFDIGGTHMRVATSADGQELSALQVEKTPKEFSVGMDKLIEIGRTLAKDQPINAICGGFPSPINSERTGLVHPPNLPDWGGKDIVKILNEEFSASVHIANDTALIGLGEATRGAGQGFEIVAFIGIGTGIGGARFVNGKIDENRWGFEPGHHIIDITKEENNSFEAYVSGSGIEQATGKKPQEINDSKFWSEVNNHLAIGLYNVSLFWSPDIIVLGGGMVLQEMFALDQVEKHLNGLNENLENVPHIVSAALGDKGGLYGALEYANRLSILPDGRQANPKSSSTK